MTDAVLCLGEILWDATPDGLFLGGAPYNVACHLGRFGCPAALGSRVGDDRLGREARREAQAAGVETHLVQTDPDLPTGLVRVVLDAGGTPSYTIEVPAAYDALALEAPLREAAAEARALVFGTLAQRDPVARATVRALVRDRAPGALAVLDVNLRPPFDSPAVVLASLEAADAVKLNADELALVARWAGLTNEASGALPDAAARLADRFGLRIVCVTRGADGAGLWHDGCWTEQDAYRVHVRDTVGAGDAFLAGHLAGVLAGQTDAEALDQACRVGAHVASQPGATPAYDAAAVLAGEA